MYYFIVNEHGRSGKAHNIWLTVQSLLEKQGIQFKSYISQSIGHATQLAQHICGLNDSDKRIVVVGGDGTINEVLNGITDFETVSFGVIPTGSGNDFSRGMKIPGNTEKALQKILQSRKDRKIDLGQVKAGEKASRIFGISCGFGLDAIVTKAVDASRLKKVLNALHMGNLTYLLLTVHCLFTMKTSTVKVCFNGNESSTFPKTIFMAAMNLPSEGGGIKMAPDAEPYDGELSMCMACGIPQWKTFFKLPFLAAGKHGKLKGFLLKNAVTFDIDSEDPMTVHADGEYVADATKVHIECLKEKLRVLI